MNTIYLHRLLTLLFLMFFSLIVKSQNNNVGIGTTTPHPKALLEVNDTAKGVLIPRLTTLQRQNLGATLDSTANGLLVYDITLQQYWYWGGTQWILALGPAGPQGPTGLQGVIGISGVTGMQGPSGADGTTGPAGPTGANSTVPGPTGPIGVNGATGPAGPTGANSTVPGPTGSIGVQGTTGPAGPTGPKGDRYATTSTNSMTIALGAHSFTVDTGLAYTVGQTVLIAFDAGNMMVAVVTSYNPTTGAMSVNTTSVTGSGTYSSWAVNLNGAPGPAGTAGAAGTTGPTGAVGSNGVTGATGPTGPIGPTGANSTIPGPTGPAGAAGPAGATGANSTVPGPTGPAGANGVTGPAGPTGANSTVPGPTGPTGPGGVSGTATQVAWFNSATTITSDPDLFWDNTNKRLGVGTILPAYRLHATGSSTLTIGGFFNSDAAGDAVNGINSAVSGIGTGAGVWGHSDQSGAGSAGVYGSSSNAAGNGVVGNNSAIAGVSTGIGVLGFTAQSGGAGIWGQNSNAAGAAVTGINTAASGTGTGANGTEGFTAQSQSFGALGSNSHTSGTGIFGVGNNATGNYLTSGGGGSFTGTSVGAIGWGTTVANGTGVAGAGNNAGIITMTIGSGGAFNGAGFGAVGFATTVASGTGILGVGNNLTAGSTSTTGSGGAFTGTSLGSGGWATTVASGTGVAGAGNNLNITTLGTGSGGAFSGTEVGVFGLASSATAAGAYGDGGTGSDASGVLGNVSTGINAAGVWGQASAGGATRYGGFFINDLGSTGAKPFMIDHPQDPENKFLKHFSIESPEILLIYRGNVILDNKGEAVVTMPSYFKAVTNNNYSYNLTPIGKSVNLFVKTELNNFTFSIGGGEPGMKVSWMVITERNDPYMQQFPEEKLVEVSKEGNAKGKYLNPELYNQPPEKAIRPIPKTITEPKIINYTQRPEQKTYGSDKRVNYLINSPGIRLRK